MEVKVIEKTVKETVIVNEFGEFSFNEVLELLDDLEGTGWAGSRIRFDDRNLQKWLTSIDVVANTNGSTTYLESDEKAEELKKQLYALHKEIKE